MCIRDSMVTHHQLQQPARSKELKAIVAQVLHASKPSPSVRNLRLCIWRMSSSKSSKVFFWWRVR
eukprot:3352363-Amphidinium_carterae.1